MRSAAVLLLVVLAVVAAGCSVVKGAASEPLGVPTPAPRSSSSPEVSATPTPTPGSTTSKPEVILVQSHMGGAALGAPNSAALFRKTSTMGFAVVEFDVQITRDGVAVINHSDRIMDMPGRPCTHDGLRIHRVSYAAMSRVRCAGEALPKLEEVLSIYRGTDVQLNVEIKAWDNVGTQPASSLRDYARRIVRQLDDAGFSGRYVISCFDWRLLIGTLRTLHPDLQVVALERSSKMKQPSTKMFAAVRDARALGADAFEVDLPFAEESLLRFIARQGMAPQLWYVNTPADVRFAIANGVNPISSDDPVMAQKVIDSLGRGALKSDPVVRQVPTRSLLDHTVTADAPTSLQAFGVAGRIPLAAQAKLGTAILSIRIEAARAGTAALKPEGASQDDSVMVHFVKGVYRGEVRVAPGDLGSINVTVSTSARVRVDLTGYELARYRPA